MDHATTADGADLNRLAFGAPAHCLTGCGTGEVLGLAIATAFGWPDAPSGLVA